MFDELMNGKPAKQEEYFDIQVTHDELNELVSILNFSTTAAKMLAGQEAVKGTYSGVARMDTIASNSVKLMDMLIANMEIGNVNTDLPN